MDKYILQKDTPSTKAGVVFTKTKDERDYKAEDESDMWKSGIVENSPEWFKVLPEQEWEILSFKHYGNIATLMEWRKYRCYSSPHYEYPGQQFGIKWALEPENKCIINSVKRLSDGQIFTISDICRVDNTTFHGPIVGFEINSNRILVKFNGSVTCWLKGIDHMKPIYAEADMKDWAKFHMNEMLSFWQTHEGQAVFPPMDIIFREWQLTKKPDPKTGG